MITEGRSMEMAQTSYKAKQFKLSGLKGISDETLKMHFARYEGYVKNTNLLMEQIAEITHKKKASGLDPAYAELTRHLGFEVGGMVLHEYYFENLAPKGRGIRQLSSIAFSITALTASTTGS